MFALRRIHGAAIRGDRAPLPIRASRTEAEPVRAPNRLRVASLRPSGRTVPERSSISDLECRVAA